jgi:hypothetical protein
MRNPQAIGFGIGDRSDGFHSLQCNGLEISEAGGFTLADGDKSTFRVEQELESKSTSSPLRAGRVPQPPRQ